MTNVTVPVYDRASAVHASEIDYAASMHFSAAYLPSGSSPSLGEDQESADTTSSVDSTPVKSLGFQRDNTQRVFAA